MAEDLRGGAALVAACLAAEGTSLLGGYEHIRRGYEDICRDLAGAGARIELLSQAENIFSDDRRKETDGIWTIVKWHNNKFMSIGIVIVKKVTIRMPNNFPAKYFFFPIL